MAFPDDGNHFHPIEPQDTHAAQGNAVHRQVQHLPEGFRQQILQHPHPEHAVRPDGIGQGQKNAPDPQEPAQFFCPGERGHAGDFPDNDLEHGHAGNENQHHHQKSLFQVQIQPVDQSVQRILLLYCLAAFLHIFHHHTLHSTFLLGGRTLSPAASFLPGSSPVPGAWLPPVPSAPTTVPPGPCPGTDSW